MLLQLIQSDVHVSDEHNLFMLVAAYVEAGAAASAPAEEAAPGEEAPAEEAPAEGDAPTGYLADTFMARIAAGIVTNVVIDGESPAYDEITVADLVPHTPEEEVVLSPA